MKRYSQGVWKITLYLMMVSLALKCTSSEVCLPLQRALWPQRAGRVSGRAGSCRAAPLCPAAAMLSPGCVHQGLRTPSPGTGAPLVLSAPCERKHPARGSAASARRAAAWGCSGAGALHLGHDCALEPGIPGSPKGLDVPLGRSISPAFSFPEHALGWAMRWDQQGMLPSWHYSSCCNCTWDKRPYEYVLVFPAQ